MKIKTSELTGPALDRAVAKCWYSDRRVELTEGKTGVRVLRDPTYDGSEHHHWFVFFGSEYWDQGGPIIERERITVVCAEGDYNPSKAGTSECYDTYWVATKGRLSASTVYGPQGDDWGSCFQIEANAIQGPTALIAAMRCFVASHLGEEIDIPDEVFQ